MNVLLCVALLGVLIYFLVRPVKKNREEPKNPSSVYYPSEDRIERKGQQGEEEVQRILSVLPKKEYIVLNDVLLPGNAGTTQIDHVVISLYGIFVIESKNYNGKIYGSHDSEKWSQYMNGKQYTFRNPIKQNLGHVLAIKNLIGISGKNLIPIVVFTGSATLKLYGCDEVVYDGMLLNTIYRYTNRVFTPKQIESYATIIDNRMDENPQTKSAHVNGIKDRVTRWNQEVDAGLCPRCEGHLVLRRGKYGAFYGCSNYPTCKYTKNL